MTRRVRPLEGIHDLVALDLPVAGVSRGVERIVALQFQDHLLRRFGQADLLRLSSGTELSRPPQDVADEVWVLVQGSVEFTWKDERSSSPTQGADSKLAATEPVAVLVPFGVSFQIRALSPSILLRLGTHSDIEIRGDSPVQVSTL